MTFGLNGSWIYVILHGCVHAVGAAGLAQGFFRSICSLGGLVLGLALAAWNYGRVAARSCRGAQSKVRRRGWIHSDRRLLVMAIFAMLGVMLAKALQAHRAGLPGWAAGRQFRILSGHSAGTLGILADVAFFRGQWLTEASCRAIFSACHLSTHTSPESWPNAYATA
jgi:membrane protein required for colicin V production